MVTEEFWKLFSPEDRARMEENHRRYREAGKGLFKDLAKIGFDVESLSDMGWPGYDGRAAVGTLLEWLPRIDYVPLKQDIVGTLGEPWAHPEALRPLIEWFRRIAPGDDTSKIGEPIGDAIRRIADESVRDDLLELAQDPRYGSSRAGIIFALGRLRKSKAVVIPVLIKLLDDDTVNIHAAEVLGNMHAAQAEPSLKEMAEGSDENRQRAAKAALAKIRRAEKRKAAAPP